MCEKNPILFFSKGGLPRHNPLQAAARLDVQIWTRGSSDDPPFRLTTADVWIVWMQLF